MVFHPANLSAGDSVAGFTSPGGLPIMGDCVNFLKGFCPSPQAIAKLLLAGAFAGKRNPIARARIDRLGARSKLAVERPNDWGISIALRKADQRTLQKPSAAPTSAWSKFSCPLTANLRIPPQSRRSSAHFREFRYAGFAFAGIALSAGKGGASV
jgi:hypothetical protein